MTDVTIVTNNQWRGIVYGYELSEKSKAEFDYLEFVEGSDDEGLDREFVRYRGVLYDLNEFIAVPVSLSDWDGYAPDSYFSGVVVRYNAADDEQVQMGTYYS